MHLHNFPWGAAGYWIFYLLKVFGILPGAVAAYYVQRLWQKRRQRRAMEGWPAIEATVLWGKVHADGPRNYWAEITYSYYVGEYRSSTYIRRFKKEVQADEFVRSLKDRKIQVHYKESNPDASVILDRDLEMIALLAPQFG